MLQSIAIVPILILVLIIALLSIPLSMNFLFMTKQGAHGYIRFNWLYGLIAFQTQFPDRTPAKLLHAKKTSKPLIKKHLNKATANESRANKSENLSLLKHAIFRRHIFNFIHRLMRATHAKNLYLKLRIGLGDPADTGALWSILGPVSGLLKNISIIRLELEPDFIDTTIELESHGHFRFIPLQLIILLLAFLLSPTTIQAWRLAQQ